MKPNRIEVFSPFPPAECAERIRAAIDADWRSSGIFFHKCVVGNVSESSLRLNMRGGCSGWFTTWFIGKMRPGSGGTIISGRFGIHPFVRGFTFLWFTILIVLCGEIFVKDARALLTGIGPLVSGVLMTWVGLSLARDEAAFIRDFVIREVHGREPKRAA